MEKDQHLIGNIHLHNDKPTDVTMKDLYSWVVWQFPNNAKECANGAVKPPEQEVGWFPALIDQTKKTISIYAHLQNEFPTPEDVNDFFNNQSQ